MYSPTKAINVDAPPRINEPAKEVDIEVLPPEAGTRAPSMDAPPIHPLSALVLVAVDSLWALFDLAPVLWVFAIPLCFIAVSLPTYLLQRHVKGDRRGRALAFAVLLATLAAIPTPISGTPVGLGLLAWSGLGKLLGKQPTMRPQRG